MVAHGGSTQSTMTGKTGMRGSRSHGAHSEGRTMKAGAQLTSFYSAHGMVLPTSTKCLLPQLNLSGNMPSGKPRDVSPRCLSIQLN